MLQLCTSPKPASSSIPTFAMASGIKRELNGGDKRLDMTLDQSFSIPPSHLAFLPSCWPLLGLVHTAKLAFDEQFLCYPWVSLQCRTSCACFKPLHYNQAPSDPSPMPSVPSDLEGWHSWIGCGEEGRGYSKWLLRSSWFPRFLAGTAFRKGEAICRAEPLVPPGLHRHMLTVLSLMGGRVRTQPHMIWSPL